MFLLDPKQAMEIFMAITLGKCMHSAGWFGCTARLLVYCTILNCLRLILNLLITRWDTQQQKIATMGGSANLKPL